MTVLVVVAVFGAGVLVGFATDSSLGAAPAPEGEVTAEERSEATGEEAPRRRQYTFERVSPDEVQRVQIDSIVVIHRARVNELNELSRATRAEHRRQFRQIVSETRSAIKDVLSEEQALQYQQLLDERDAREAAERERRDRPE
jgi:Spy/CpxP family protein refolding chaperone